MGVNFMGHKVKNIKPLDDNVLMVTFFDGTIKEYDVKCLYGIFPQFRVFDVDVDLFNQVKVDTGGYGISWNDDLDLDADDIWEYGKTIGQEKERDIALLFAQQLSDARAKSGLTQKQLSEITGIYQADISKIERGIGNPSLLTLKRIADGIGVTLRVELIY